MYGQNSPLNHATFQPKHIFTHSQILTQILTQRHIGIYKYIYIYITHIYTLTDTDTDTDTETHRNVYIYIYYT
jgi:hypothetical protein